MGKVTEQMLGAARTMRRGDYADASSELNRCMESVQSALGSGRIPPEQVKKLAYSFETMLLMQQQGDWVGLADVIEYELSVLWEQAGVESA